MLQARASKRMGIEVLLNADTAQIRGRDQRRGRRVEGRPRHRGRCGGGRGRHPAQCRSCAQAAGLAVERGIVVDDVAAKRASAASTRIGECAEHRGICYGLVEPAYEQARVLARRSRAAARRYYAGSVIATNLKVSGVNVFSAGDFIGATAPRRSSSRDPRARHLQEARRSPTAAASARCCSAIPRRALVSRPDPLRRRYRAHCATI